MSAWWNALSILQQALFVIACAATLFMVVQIVMMLIAATRTRTDAPISTRTRTAACGGHDVFTVFGLRILSVRTVVAFFAVGGWVAFTVDFVLPTYAAILIGVAAGIAAAFLMAYALGAVMKLQGSGNIDLKNGVGHMAEVYLTVPPARTGVGKLSLTLQERLIEVNAVTDCGEAIPTGALVRITGLADDETAEVEPVGETTRVAGNR